MNFSKTSGLRRRQPTLRHDLPYRRQPADADGRRLLLGEPVALVRLGGQERGHLRHVDVDLGQRV